MGGEFWVGDTASPGSSDNSSGPAAAWWFEVTRPARRTKLVAAQSAESDVRGKRTVAVHFSSMTGVGRVRPAVEVVD